MMASGSVNYALATSKRNGEFVIFGRLRTPPPPHQKKSHRIFTFHMDPSGQLMGVRTPGQKSLRPLLVPIPANYPLHYTVYNPPKSQITQVKVVHRFVDNKENETRNMFKRSIFLIPHFRHNFTGQKTKNDSGATRF